MSELTLSELRGPFGAPSPSPVPWTRPSGASRAALHRQLDTASAGRPEYRDGLSNHLPMALHALHELGADEARLRAFATRYVDAHGLAEPLAGEASAASSGLLEGDWRAHRGHWAMHDAFRARFAHDLAREGREAVLARAIPGLLDGVSAQAFHGPIRVAHAVEAGHDGELAAALAYWAARWQPVPAPGQDTGDRFDDVDDWLDALDDAWRRHDTPPAVRRPLISARLAEAATTQAYHRLGSALRTEGRDADDLLQRLALAAARRYAGSRNLTVLHLVTGARALRVFAARGWLPAEATAGAWHAVAASSLAAGPGTPGALAASPVSAPDWDTLRDHAIAQDDDHVVKIVHALWTIPATHAGTDGRRAAAVACRLSPGS